MLSNLGIRIPFLLELETVWAPQGAAVVFMAEGRVFRMHRDANSELCRMFVVDGDVEREIAQIEANDPCFQSRFLVAIADAV